MSATTRLALRGLTAAPAQIFGNVRLVPLIRDRVREDLRIARRRYDASIGVVALGGAPSGVVYASVIPHGFVISWTGDGSPVAAFGTAMARRSERPDGKALVPGVRLLHRMAKREGDGELRLLPLHLAMEGFLALHFGGPDIAWAEYSREAISRGLDPRWERSVGGGALPGFEDALRVFEIHERQAGVLVFVADALASAFVVPHPDDYRALHRSLLLDFYGELLFRYAMMFPEAVPAEASIDDRAVSSLDDLRRGVAAMRADWADFTALLAEGVFGREVRSELVYRMDAFRLERFMTDLRLHEENHIGEAIFRDDGAVEYLKTYRLSDAQARRAYLLEQLAAHGWSLDDTAAALRTTKAGLVVRLSGAGFGYLLRPHVLEAAQRKPRGRGGA